MLRKILFEAEQEFFASDRLPERCPFGGATTNLCEVESILEYHSFKRTLLPGLGGVLMAGAMMMLLEARLPWFVPTILGGVGLAILVWWVVWVALTEGLGTLTNWENFQGRSRLYKGRLASAMRSWLNLGSVFPFFCGIALGIYMADGWWGRFALYAGITVFGSGLLLASLYITLVFRLTTTVRLNRQAKIEIWFPERLKDTLETFRSAYRDYQNEQAKKLGGTNGDWEAPVSGN